MFCIWISFLYRVGEKTKRRRENLPPPSAELLFFALERNRHREHLDGIEELREEVLVGIVGAETASFLV